ncbi:hypothetical protein PLICRDRAFT_662037 [Plicaturopsis crispa FD-325 SS-3]|nr:hypothetical protein PLICRDRAFT_662037 [Plicaturopsis crispa FD-325 SS-3]
MSVGSPTAYLLWAILASVFWGFIIYHLWCYDKFQCLRWNSGRQPGAFKRIMTYSYLISVPLFLVFGVAMTVLKFKEGALRMPIPWSDQDWRDDHRRWILPLYFVFCGGWAFELVTHLEELLFWVFLFNQGPGKREWFGSSECRAWYIGTLTALLGMPLVALVSRTDLDQSEAWIFLVGSSAGTATTILFLYVLARFPRFLRHVKHEGATPDVVVRLTTFYHLNRARVCFRFLFTVPLFVLAIDSIVGKRDIVFDPFWSDFLLMISGLGCFSSSAITLLIFFPRSNVEAPNPVAGHISPPMSPHQEYIHHKHSLGYQPPSPRSPKAYAMPVDTTIMSTGHPCRCRPCVTREKQCGQHKNQRRTPEPFSTPMNHTMSILDITNP